MCKNVDTLITDLSPWDLSRRGDGNKKRNAGLILQLESSSNTRKEAAETHRLGSETGR